MRPYKSFEDENLIYTDDVSYMTVIENIGDVSVSSYKSTCRLEGAADIGLIQEPFLNKRKNRGFWIRGFKFLRSAGNGYHRVCIFARSNFNIFLLVEYCNEYMFAVNLELFNTQY